MSEQSGAHLPTSAYFDAISPGHYRPTEAAGGAWNSDEIHFSPLGGLIVHAIDLHRAAAEGGVNGKELGRISFDILGFLAATDCEIRVETIRPGRTIELIEATVIIAGRPAVLARAWFIATTDTSGVAGGQPAPLPSPDRSAPWSMVDIWPGGYIASLDFRSVAPPLPGKASAWLRTEKALVAGEPSSPHAMFIALVDTANGIAVRQSPLDWAYPNLDLTIHFHRQPTGNWVGLDTTVTFGPAGHGLTSSVLHDEDGPVGRAEQILTVRPLS
ncbi:thioesterase family protein [Cryobacterium psychrophilum]|uniref:Thioesterase family protein n=1 Tax=Cryobacterium psychrophilum TaxID=41988 RepID=A0A4Y8KL37_9MICO|nr:thioesterase family protein [Cryobacterium psychrophilum]TDW29859.1 thioesterase superfamily protein [Cryobacterium psychrophilum]TFD76756.1 thioesterase family protein [Cryobacterium psychrophilum]